VGWGPRREVVLEKGIWGGTIGGIVIVSLDLLFIIVAFLSQTSLTSRQLDTQVLEVHILYYSTFEGLQNYKSCTYAHVHTHLIKTLNIYIIHVSVKLGYVELQIKI
jgi:hypothetical protein